MAVLTVEGLSVGNDLAQSLALAQECPLEAERPSAAEPVPWPSLFVVLVYLLFFWWVGARER